MQGQSVFLSAEQSVSWVQTWGQEGYRFAYDKEKHRFLWEIDEHEVVQRLPLTLFVNTEGVLVPEKEVNYLMVLVQSGSASLGVFQGSKCLEHKVFTSYMVRKKQGKSQIKHLKTKGKSRAGSRVRLASGMAFFENINERLQRHFDNYAVDRIAFSCSKILLPHLFNAKTPTPFDKNDERIFRIPKHLHQPNYEVMMKLQRFLEKGEIIFTSDQYAFFKDRLEGLTLSN